MRTEFSDEDKEADGVESSQSIKSAVKLERPTKVGSATGELEGFVRLPVVMRLTGYKKTALRTMIAKGLFPRPFRLGAPGSRAVGWRLDELREYINSRPRAD